MKAAIVTAAGKTPVYADFTNPAPKDGEEIIAVRAAALSNLTKSRASGAHYSSTGIFPAIAGMDGVGVTPDGRRFYFAMPEAPYGSMAEFCPIVSRRCLEIPDSVDDITAAAIANPGMSAWAALVERARLVAGETVLVNGATGTAGRIAVQIAKYLGAAKVIATGRNAKELEEVKLLGADAVIPFAIDAEHPNGAAAYQEALQETFAGGIDIVVDYLWGHSATAIITALARTVEDNPVRFVHVGASAGQSVDLPGAALRSAAITLMGSGIGSVSRKGLMQSISKVFDAIGPAKLKLATQVVPLSQVESVWEKASGKPRVVFTIS
jgi:NADPH:quinone reductase-like Zn-dependent oxidoreductase